MIFRIITAYRKTKQGIADPKGFAVDELHDAFLGFFIVPALVLIGVLVVLGILAFTSLITPPSVVAMVFFWIFVFVFVLYAVTVYALRRLLDYVIAQVSDVAASVAQSYNQQ